MGGPLLVGGLTAMSVLILFVAMWRMSSRVNPVDERLQEYGGVDPAEVAVSTGSGGTSDKTLSGLGRILNGFGMGPVLAERLTRADIPLKVPEFALIVIGAAGLGFLVGSVRVGLPFGIILGVVLGYAPILYLRFAVGRRQRKFTEQLPDVLDLLVGSLRAGYGLSQALGALVEQLPPPASDEFRRVTRSTELGLSVEQALTDMSDRIDAQEVGLVVTAINVQHEMGGNLAETLDTIAETVRDRIRMKGEIRSLTSQQRLTGYILAALPIFMAFLLNMVNPMYMNPLFEPGMMRIVAIAAVVLQVMGFIVISKIVDIEV